MENLKRIIKDLGQTSKPTEDFKQSNNQINNENNSNKNIQNPFSKEAILSFLSISQIDCNFEVKIKLINIKLKFILKKKN